ncbi:MAG: agmatine deiminase family protein [Flavobacteriales bacterium]|nr:agmatine deiminase family protein [Flavobacteriales bacterium]
MSKNYFLFVVIIIISLLFVIPLSAQQEILPKGFAPGEELQMDGYLQQAMNPASRSSITIPPGLPVRTAAQWEEVQALVITWTSYPAILREIVRAAQTECMVIIHCADSNAVKNNLTTHGVPLNNLKFIQVGFNSIWIRDYGANTCYLNDVDSLILVDWIYNRPRPLDDQIPAAYASLLGIPLFETNTPPHNLMNTGGNWMVDGMGTAFASKLILDENDGSGTYSIAYPNHTEAEINQIVSDFMGINRYIKMETLPYDEIHHIDMHMKLLNEETILVGEFPTGISDGPQLEANLQYVLNNFQSSFGTPYKLVRIPMPPSTSGNYAPDAYYRTYTNFVIVNKTIIMPVYREQYDTTAVHIIKEQMPGYKIVTIDSDNSNNNSDLNQNLISAGGVIHCITHTVGVNDPLRIVHNDLEDTWNTSSPYQVDALIQHKSGIATATVYWTTDTTLGYQAASMSLTNPATDTWTGYIPAQLAGSKIFYYIQATANSGKQQVRPMPAPQGYWKFNVLGNVSAEENAIDVFSLKAYPNPSKGITCIPVFNQQNEKITLKIYDINGKIVETCFMGDATPGYKNYFINTSKYPSGIYYIVFQSLSCQAVQKLVVK